ncbi:MAG TPA: hypothetical protein VLB05_03230 [Dongiaceae bacterium]|nr:hypothetical protein [Dongiaceae bacterium]
MSIGYRIHLLEHGEHIAAVGACDCPTDVDALLEADAMLQASQYSAVEVWNGSRLVGMLSKPLGRSDRSSPSKWSVPLFLSRRLKQAQARVAAAQLLVDDQRARVTHFEKRGRDTLLSRHILAQVERMLAVHVEERDRLQKQLDQVRDSIWKGSAIGLAVTLMIAARDVMTLAVE